MTAFTVDDFFRLLRSAGGEPEDRPLTSEVVDDSFDDLGYDSLARLEVASRVEREFGVSLPDDIVPDLRTPREFVEHVNALAVAP